MSYPHQGDNAGPKVERPVLLANASARPPGVWSLLVSMGRARVAEAPPGSPWVEGCVAGIRSSSSLSEEELWAVPPEAWAFLVVFMAWTCPGVGAGTAGPRLGLTETGGDLIALKNKNRNIPPLIKGLVRREGEMGEGGFL